MSKPVIYVWPEEDDQAVAEYQDVAANGLFILNGADSNINTGVGVPVVSFGDVSRTVTISSLDNDYTGVSFIISGTLNSSNVFEEIEGPGAGETVDTLQYFDTVTSVSVDADVQNVGVGSGTQGMTHWYKCDYNRTINSFSFQVAVVGTIEYSLQATLDDVQENEFPLTFDITGELTDQTTSKLVNTGIFPINYCSLRINSSEADGALIFTILESGLV